MPLPEFDLTQRNARNRQYVSPLATAPWREITVEHLTRVEEFGRGSGWGKNSWGEVYKGPTMTAYYVRIPAELNLEHNVLVHLSDRRMIIECGQAPAFTKPKSSHSPELMAYFPWDGGV